MSVEPSPKGYTLFVLSLIILFTAVILLVGDRVAALEYRRQASATRPVEISANGWLLFCAVGSMVFAIIVLTLSDQLEATFIPLLTILIIIWFWCRSMIVRFRQIRQMEIERYEKSMQPEEITI